MVSVHMSDQLANEAKKVGVRGACAKSDIGCVVEAVETLLQTALTTPLDERWSAALEIHCTKLMVPLKTPHEPNLRDLAFTCAVGVTLFSLGSTR